MDPAEVSVNKRVPGLGVVARTVGEPQMPPGVFVPRVRPQERVLIAGPGLDLAPIAVQYVLAGIDQLPRVRHGLRVHGIRSHHIILPARGGSRGCAWQPLDRGQQVLPLRRRLRQTDGQGVAERM